MNAPLKHITWRDIRAGMEYKTFDSYTDTFYDVNVTNVNRRDFDKSWREPTSDQDFVWYSHPKYGICFKLATDFVAMVNDGTDRLNVFRETQKPVAWHIDFEAIGDTKLAEPVCGYCTKGLQGKGCRCSPIDIERLSAIPSESLDKAKNLLAKLYFSNDARLSEIPDFEKSIALLYAIVQDVKTMA